MVLYLDVDTPEKYAGLSSFYIESESGLDEHKIERLRLKQNLAFIKLENISKIEEAEHFLRKAVYLPLSFLPDLDDKNFYLHEVIGFSVHDKAHGSLGRIESIMEMPAQRLLQINSGKKEILIPVNTDFVSKVDRTEKILYLDTPEGLIDVYLYPGKDED